MKEYMFIPTEMKATNRFDYECEANDVRVRYCFKDGKIDDVRIKVDGDVGWTVIGWGDLTGRRYALAGQSNHKIKYE